MLFAIVADVIALTALLLDERTKRIVPIDLAIFGGLNGFQYLFQRCTLSLICIEPNIHTIRQIIRIDSHALQVMSSRPVWILSG